MESLTQIRDRVAARYGMPPTPVVEVPSTDVEDQPREPALLVTAAATGHTIITTAVRQKASTNSGFLYLHGRFVEADRANRNGAYWTSDDLELGAPTVAGGPLNWLHEETHIIGTLLDGELVVADREVARDFSTDKRKKLAKTGAAMGDGSFPIQNAEDLRNAIRLAGNAKDPAKAKAHIRSRAKALGLTSLLPDSWGREKADDGVGNHIRSTAAVWKFLYPKEAALIEKAAADRQLFYSMECVSQNVQCVDGTAGEGCQEIFPYADYLSDKTKVCPHLREAASAKRFIDPVFLGGAVIVPPIVPGWDHAEVEVVRQAAAAVEASPFAELDRQAAETMVSRIITWADTPR